MSSEASRTFRRILRWALPLLGGAVLLSGGVLTWVIVTSEPPATSLEAARIALEGARIAEAPRYAKAEYEIAQGYVQRAQLAYRRAEARLFGFREYDEVGRRLEEARVKANEAMDISRRRRDDSSARATEIIAAAEEALQTARLGAGRVPFSGTVRLRVTQAEISIAEARKNYRDGNYLVAAEKADGARRSIEGVNKRIDSFLTEYTTGDSARKWQKWVSQTIAESRSSGAAIIVDKMNRKCLLYRNGKLVRTYSVDLGANPTKPKFRSGDRATPEGRYKVTQKRGRGQTVYYKALMLNYPNEEDRQRFLEAKRKGWISPRARIGGLIEIHGDGGREEDWTLGCVALHNSDMDHLFDQVNVGTPVTIVGTLSKS